MQKTLSGWPFPRHFGSEFPFTVGNKATSCKQWTSCRRLESDTGTSEHLALKMLTSCPSAKRKSLQLLPVRWLGHLRRTRKAWRLGLEQMLPRSEEPVIKSSMGVQTLSRTRLVPTHYKVGVLSSAKHGVCPWGQEKRALADSIGFLLISGLRTWAQCFWPSISTQKQLIAALQVEEDKPTA